MFEVFEGDMSVTMVTQDKGACELCFYCNGYLKRKVVAGQHSVQKNQKFCLSSSARSSVGMQV